MEALWSQFENVMAKAPEEGEGDGDGKNEDREDAPEGEANDGTEGRAEEQGRKEK